LKKNAHTKSLSSSFARGIAFTFGVVFTLSIIALILFFLYQSGYRGKNVVNKLKTLYGYISNINAEVKPLVNAPNFSNSPNPYTDSEFSPPLNLNQIIVQNTKELTQAINKANKSKNGSLLLLNNGVYTLSKTLQIKADSIMVSSLTGLAEDVIVQGSQSPNTGIGNLFRVTGKHFILSGITLRNAKNHLVQIAGESDADFPVIRNCILQDSYQQLLKVSYNKDKTPQISSDYGLVENCRFEYTRGIGPNYYIGGIDLHAGNGWIIRNNKFKDIASPSQHIAEHAIHAWNNAYNTLVENNTFKDCDRGIGFGMGQGNKHPSISYSHRGGVIRNNIIIHNQNNDPFADTGIILEDSPETIIANNKIWLAHDYPNAIEYRFPSTVNIIISNNITNKNIQSRNGANAELNGNTTDARIEDILINDL
jgi:hypothetical protein